jgi:hypothetical protein
VICEAKVWWLGKDNCRLSKCASAAMYSTLVRVAKK